MALPQTISGISYPASSYNNLGVFRPSNGNHYAVFTDGTSIVVFSADNGDNTWSEQDSVNAPTTTANHASAVLDGTDIHIISADYNGFVNGTSVDYYYHTFDTTTDAWSTTDESVSATLDTDCNIAFGGCDLAVRSDGSVVAVVIGASEKIMGTDYARVDYYIRSTGGTWGSAVAVDDAGQVFYNKPRCILGTSNKVHITYVLGSSANGDVVHKSLNSSDSLSSAETVFTSLGSNQTPRLDYYDNSGNEEIYILRQNGSALSEYVITNDGTPSGATSITATSASTGRITVDENTGKRYAVWANSGDIYYNEYDSSWGSDVSVLTGTLSIRYASVLVNDAGDTVLAYVYDDGGTSKYNEYTIATGTTSYALTSSLTITPSTNADNNADRPISSDSTLTGTTNADNNAQRPITSAINATASTNADNNADRPISSSITATASTNADNSKSVSYALTSSLTITTTANADNNADRPLSSAISITPSTNADNNASRPIASSLTITATTTGDNNASRAITGDVTLTATTSADNSSGLPLTSSLTITATTTGDNNASRAISSSITTTASATADNNADRPLSASTTLTASTNGDNTKVGDLSLTSSLTLTGTTNADNNAQRPLTSPVSLNATTSADNNASRSITGDVTLTATTNADNAKDIVSLALTSSLTITTTANADNNADRPLSSAISITPSTNADNNASRPIASSVSITATTNADSAIIGLNPPTQASIGRIKRPDHLEAYSVDSRGNQIRETIHYNDRVITTNDNRRITD